MKKYALVVLPLVSAAVMSGCAAMSTRSPVTGFLYSDNQTAIAATSNQAGNRVGEACATSILGLVGTGDASIEAARRNGGITMITSVDAKNEAYVGVYAKTCTIVRGR
jgi:hypothetical protein